MLARLIGWFRPQWVWIDAATLHARIAAKPALARVIDVRSPAEFVEPLGHIPGAVCIPLADLPGQTARVASGAGSVPIALVCLSDKRSTRAAKALAQAGLRILPVVQGGMQGWQVAGFPAERGRDQL